MKKLIPTLLLLLPVAGHTELVSHDFVINELPPPSVSKGEFNLIALPNTTIYQGWTYNCSVDRKTWKCLFSDKRSERFLFKPSFADNFSHLGFRCYPSGLFEAQLGFSLNGSVSYLTIGRTGEGNIMVTPGRSNDLYAVYLYLIGKTGGGAGSGAECTIYGGSTTQPYKTPIGKFTIGSNFGSNNIPFGLTITPTILTLTGRPAWSGAVRINGSGYAGRLMIQSDRDIRINLGQGWSGNGRSFETRLLSGDKVLSYDGQMKVAGEVQTSGTTTYNVRVTHVLE